MPGREVTLQRHWQSNPLPSLSCGLVGKAAVAILGRIGPPPLFNSQLARSRILSNPYSPQSLNEPRGRADPSYFERKCLQRRLSRDVRCIFCSR